MIEVDQPICIKVNLTTTNAPQMRQALAEAHILPTHLRVDWLHLYIQHTKSDLQERWWLTPQTSYYSNYPSINVTIQQFIEIFSLVYVSPNLPASTYLEMAKFKRSQVKNLENNVRWNAWVMHNYPPRKSQPAQI